MCSRGLQPDAAAIGRQVQEWQLLALDHGTDATRDIRQQLELEVQNLHKTPCPPSGTEKEISPALLDIRPIIEPLMGSIEGPVPFPLFESFPRFAAQQIDVVFETEGGEYVRPQ